MASDSVNMLKTLSESSAVCIIHGGARAKEEAILSDAG